MGDLTYRFTALESYETDFVEIPSDQYLQEVLCQMIQEYSSNHSPINIDFRKLIHWLRAGDQLTHHIHPYPAKLLPHIAYFF